MNFQETVDWLYTQLPVYQRDGFFKYKIDLSSIKSFCNYLNNPQNSFESIHVAGTNGKGSSSHMLASIFQEANLNVGLYTSPHLIDFRERIRLNGEKIKKKDVTSFVENHKIFIEENNISFFEITVAMAFDYFSKSNVDIAIIETGLGGRLDATNIINPILSLITNVGLDHEKYLGDTIKKIAKEKAGIIKKSGPVVISEYQPAIKDIFIEKAESLDTKIYFVKSLKNNFNTDLKGSFQKNNVAGVVKSISILNNFKIKKNNIQKGLMNVVKNTELKGRWEVFSKSPLTICDTGHNLDAFKEIKKSISNIHFKKLRIVIGFVEEKNFKQILDLLPKDAVYYFCQPDIKRALSVEKVFEYSKKISLSGYRFNSVKNAYTESVKNADKKDLIFVGGSNFVISDLFK
tara:strand:+ start:5888 stop:7099 length:1212 start_codon:yes stop_codon:yes gene_type:complete